MSRVDFYLLKSDSAQRRLSFVCRLTEKAYQQGKKPIYIHSQNREELACLDEQLWTFSPTAFLPHVWIDADQTAPILLGDHANVEARLLIHLGGAEVIHRMGYSRVAEVVPADEALREKAREDYKFYQKHHCELHVHEV